MAKNDFKPFATGKGANVTSQPDWEALPALLSGFTAGKASSAQVNKALRQASFIAAALAQYTASKSGQDVLDDGDLSGFIAKMSAAFGKDFQTLDATLTALAGLATGADKLPYFTGNDTAGQTDLTSVGRDIIGKASIADILTYLGLGETAKQAAGALQKSQNGADIQDKSKFIENIGISDEIARSAESIVHSGDNIDNLNDAPKNSTSFSYGSAANSPGFNATILTVSSLNDTFEMQIAIGYNPLKVAFRSKNGDTSAWQSWLVLGSAAGKDVGKSTGSLIQVERGSFYANAETVTNSNLNSDQYGSKFILQGGGSGNDLFGGYGAGIITGYDIPTKINSAVFVRSDGSLTSAFRNNGTWTVVYNPSGFRRGAITSIATPGGGGGESKSYDAPGGSFVCGLTNFSNNAYITISAIRVAPMQVKLNGNWVTIDG